jgi:hypothetical protein
MALPGVKTIVKDRFYSVSRQDTPVGPRICVVGTRNTEDGTGNVADLDVVQVTKELDVITAFGEGSQLHKAYKELIAAGGDRIFMVPLPKDTVFNHTTGALTSQTSGGTDIFNDAFSAVEVSMPDVVVPWGRGGNPSDWEFPAASPSDDEEYGFHADNSTTVSQNWAYKVAEKIKEISENTNPCIAVMGIRPYLGTSSSTSTSEVMTPGNVSNHLALTNLPNKNAASGTTLTWGDLGRYVIVIAAEVKPVSYSSANIADFGYANGATTFAASLSRMASYVSPVNKTVFNITRLRYNPTRTQMSNNSGTGIIDKGVNAIILNFNKVPVYAEGLTFAPAVSDYVRISTSRIVSEATLVVRQVCQKFIGEASTMQVRNSMETAITSGLRGMQQLGALLDSDFTVSYIPSENKALIDLVLTPAFELKTIEVSIAVNL